MLDNLVVSACDCLSQSTIKVSVNFLEKISFYLKTNESQRFSVFIGGKRIKYHLFVTKIFCFLLFWINWMSFVQDIVTGSLVNGHISLYSLSPFLLTWVEMSYLRPRILECPNIYHVASIVQLWWITVIWSVLSFLLWLVLFTPKNITQESLESLTVLK